MIQVKRKFVFSALMMVMIVLVAMTIKVDFSGEWVLDQQKSNLGEMGGRMAASKLKVSQDGKIFTVIRTSNGQMGEIVTTDKLTFDGMESTSTGGWEGSVRKAILKLADDQNTLTVNAVIMASINGNGTSFEIKAKEIWSLSADSKTLTIDSETTTQMGVTNAKLVYSKQ